MGGEEVEDCIHVCSIDFISAGGADDDDDGIGIDMKDFSIHLCNRYDTNLKYVRVVNELDEDFENT